MNALKLIYQTLIQFGKLIGSLPQSAAEAFRQRKRQRVLHELLSRTEAGQWISKRPADGLGPHLPRARDPNSQRLASQKPTISARLP